MLSEKIKKPRKIHKLSYKKEFHVWRAMMRRCYDKENPMYKRYGARGITVCDRWKDVATFISDIGTKPSSKHSLDRINNNGNYEPSNVQWATVEQQANNTSTNRFITYKGETLTMIQWSRKVNMPCSSLKHRLDAGWSIEDSLTIPRLKSCRFALKKYKSEVGE